MGRLLQDNQNLLDNWDELKSLLDMDHFQEKIREYLRAFGLSSGSVFTANYSSSSFLALVTTPANLWVNELRTTLLNAVDVHTGNNTKSTMQLKFMPQIEPWTITVTIILTNAAYDQINRFYAMKNETAPLRDRERILYRSFLLEQGVDLSDDTVDQFIERSRKEVTT